MSEPKAVATPRRLLYKTFVLALALLVFAAISAAPFLFWKANPQQLKNFDWLMGMSMIIWFPLAVSLGSGLAALIAYLLWPRKKPVPKPKPHGW